ncbi:unannotated protein [freshwater metagenome]|uniref:Unannotated protein n=1 Tax=freshwater metagenome TaxID=449393 RepID=A0A6J6SGP8_9ZZZZ
MRHVDDDAIAPPVVAHPAVVSMSASVDPVRGNDVTVADDCVADRANGSAGIDNV